jgi:16S rRNA (cytidine1402-2'-O)-methyltransferase
MATLYLIPTPLVDEGPITWFTPADIELLNTLTEFVVEDERTARRFLRKAGYTRHFDEVTLYNIGKNSKVEEYKSYLANAAKGTNIGLMSEAGCPGVADPGAEVVASAHRLGITVKPMLGPSSILMALMASGLNGQSFTFHGYLPIDKDNRAGKLKAIERLSVQHKQTQLFIETPFRNNPMLDAILESCNPQTRLCIACNVMADNEFIKTQTLNQWAKNKPDLHKKPVVFLLMG